MKETFAPTVCYSTICIVLALAALEDLELCSVGISHAYLNGALDMMQPEGFEVGGPDHVYKLVKLLYGLKQAGRVWKKTIHSALSSMGFNHVQSDHGLYIYLRDDVRLLMPVFVDDITITCKDGAKIDSVIQGLSQHFKLQDLGPTTHWALKSTGIIPITNCPSPRASSVIFCVLFICDCTISKLSFLFW